MNRLICYKTMPEWTYETLPKAFKNKHNTKLGTWAKLTIFSGQLKYYALDTDNHITDTFIFNKNSDIPFIEPQAWHKVEPLTNDLHCQLSFYCLPENYYQKKYHLSATHSEVLNVTNLMGLKANLNDSLNIKELMTALDLGCGSGRNTLYLQGLGFAVTALDKDEQKIGQLRSIMQQENLNTINLNTIDARIADIQAIDKLQLTSCYDLVISTVVLMFLDEDKVPKAIHSMQQKTKVGGYNLIVCAMDTDDYPYSKYQGRLPFEYGLKSGQLPDYYQDWQIDSYNEDIGYLHRLDTEGNPITLRFATLIAKRLV